MDEHDVTLLPNGSIIALLRNECDNKVLSGARGGQYLQKISHDGGRSWAVGADMSGIGSVCPRLLMVPGSAATPNALLLSGGRGRYSGQTTGMNSDNQLWVNCGPRELGSAGWRRVSISDWHNRLETTGEPSRRFTPAINSTSIESHSYTSLLATGPSSAIIIYAQHMPGYPRAANSHYPLRAWSMRFRVECNPQS